MQVDDNALDCFYLEHEVLQSCLILITEFKAQMRCNFQNGYTVSGLLTEGSNIEALKRNGGQDWKTTQRSPTIIGHYNPKRMKIILYLFIFSFLLLCIDFSLELGNKHCLLLSLLPNSWFHVKAKIANMPYICT